jgi:hypothetical protein
MTIDDLLADNNRLRQENLCQQIEVQRLREEREWISVKDRLPPLNECVLILYSKGNKSNWTGRKGRFITQGFYSEEVIWDKSIRKIWYDYTERQIQDLGSNSKNCVSHWMPLIELPKQ